MLATDKMYEYRVITIFAVLSNYLICYSLFIIFKECLFIHPLDCAGLLCIGFYGMIIFRYILKKYNAMFETAFFHSE